MAESGLTLLLSLSMLPQIFSTYLELKACIR